MGQQLVMLRPLRQSWQWVSGDGGEEWEMRRGHNCPTEGVGEDINDGDENERE